MDRILLDRYAQGADQIRQAIAGLSREQMLAFPVSNTWSIQQIVRSADWLPWPRAVQLVDGFSAILGATAALYWLMPVADRLGRMASLAFLLGCGYLSIVGYLWPWYQPPVALLGGLAIVGFLNTLARLGHHRLLLPVNRLSVLGWLAVGLGAWWYLAEIPSAWRCVAAAMAAMSLAAAGTHGNRPHRDVSAGRLLALGCAGAILAGYAALLGLTAVQMHIQQQVIEDGNRKQIGLWLKDHVNAGERVLLEPLGYIGYYSGCRMIDSTGLVSPEVVALKPFRLNTFTLIPRLEPEWVVLRLAEMSPGYTQGAEDYFNKHYQFVRAFDVRAELNKHEFVPGRGYLDFDAVYLVFHRQPGARAVGHAAGTSLLPRSSS